MKFLALPPASEKYNGKSFEFRLLSNYSYLEQRQGDDHDQFDIGIWWRHKVPCRGGSRGLREAAILYNFKNFDYCI